MADPQCRSGARLAERAGDRQPFGALGPAGAALVVAMVGLHCSQLPAIPDCGQIPGEGCPVGRGGTCDDRSCSALYACQNDQWQLVETCPSHGGTGGEGGGGGAAAGGFGGGPGSCSPGTIDHAGEQSGCDPDLVEAPDCPVEAAESCHPCETGCEDFFICLTEGWELVAYCSEEGELVIAQ